MSRRNNVVAIGGPPANRTPDAELEPVCDREPYPRYAPGLYEARCLDVRIYRHPLLRRHLAELKFELLWREDARFPSGAVVQPVVGFFNLGRGGEPKAGRGSRYYKAWLIANGQPPRKGQRLSRRVFKDKIFLVRVGDVTRGADGQTHHPTEIYSTVKEVLEKTVG